MSWFLSGGGLRFRISLYDKPVIAYTSATVPQNVMQLVPEAIQLQEEGKGSQNENLEKGQTIDAASRSSNNKNNEAKMDGGWRAWCSVVASFLQFAICLGGPNAFGVFQAEYSLVQFPEASDLVSYHLCCITGILCADNRE